MIKICGRVLHFLVIWTPQISTFLKYGGICKFDVIMVVIDTILVYYFVDHDPEIKYFFENGERAE